MTSWSWTTPATAARRAATAPRKWRISRAGGTAREVLAYLSIGEAEDYRYYFDPGWVYPFGGQPNGSAPCWLARTNPDWAGNYKVQYWSDAWQRIILGYLDRIIDDGFDGVYLDIVDAFEYWGDSDNGEGYFISEEEAAVRMINFVKRIAHHARTVRGMTDFLIVPQNGERILDYDTGLQYLGAGDYLATISGIGVEDLYFMETSPIPAGETADRKTYLDTILGAGKTGAGGGLRGRRLAARGQRGHPVPVLPPWPTGIGPTRPGPTGSWTRSTPSPASPEFQRREHRVITPPPGAPAGG